MTTQEQWRPIPGFEASYAISNRGRVKSNHRIILRRNGSPYTVRERVLQQKRHPVSGLLTVALAQGRRGHYRTAHVHRLVDDLFGDQATTRRRTE